MHIPNLRTDLIHQRNQLTYPAHRHTNPQTHPIHRHTNLWTNPTHRHRRSYSTSESGTRQTHGSSRFTDILDSGNTPDSQMNTIHRHIQLTDTPNSQTHQSMDKPNSQTPQILQYIRIRDTPDSWDPADSQTYLIQETRLTHR
jgi:hypothetical protein